MRVPKVVEAIGFEVPPQIYDEDLMSPEEAAAAHAKVDAWYAALAAQEPKE